MAKCGAWVLMVLLATIFPEWLDCHAQDSVGSHTAHDQQCGASHAACGSKESQQQQQLTDEEMFLRGHMKPFGAHRPPDAMVEELEYMISPQDFFMKYMVKHKPVVLKGAVKYWPAYTKWTDEYLRQTYGNATFNMETKDDDKWNIPPGMKLAEFLDTYQSANRYLVDEVLPDMRRDVVLPLCLRCEEMSTYFFVSYFWMSNGGTSSSIHIDTDENLLCVLHGHKSVILVSPVHSGDLHADEARVLGVAEIDPQAVDMERFPRVKNVRYLVANVEEGDIVYIPQMWWHQVISRPGRQQAVALWWKSKPWWKKQGRKAVPIRSTSVAARDPRQKYSFSRVLSDYEHWVQNVSEHTPWITCRDQNSFMSEYLFETDKIEGAPHTRGDNDDDDGAGAESADEDDPTPHCGFDRSHPQSPCRFARCANGDQDPECVRHVLRYCAQFDDRGCVVVLPQFMNKMLAADYHSLVSSETANPQNDRSEL